MNAKEILERIVSENGSCDWVAGINGSYPCDHCPIAKLKVRDDGTSVSCLEIVGAEGEPDDKKANAKYLNVAKKLLFEAEVEKQLTGEPDDHR